MADTGDLASITELMIQYCDLIDRGDLAGWAALVEKGAWGIVGTLAQGAEEVSAQLDNVTLQQLKMVLGFSNTVILTWVTLWQLRRQMPFWMFC